MKTIILDIIEDDEEDVDVGMLAIPDIGADIPDIEDELPVFVSEMLC